MVEDTKGDQEDIIHKVEQHITIVEEELDIIHRLLRLLNSLREVKSGEEKEVDSGSH